MADLISLEVTERVFATDDDETEPGFMIAWNPRCVRKPNEPWIKAAPWPNRTEWTEEYLMTDGDCYAEWQRADPVMRGLLVLAAFNTCVVRDGVPVELAHEQFLKCPEYRRRISPETPGAADWW